MVQQPKGQQQQQLVTWRKQRATFLVLGMLLVLLSDSFSTMPSLSYFQSATNRSLYQQDNSANTDDYDTAETIPTTAVVGNETTAMNSAILEEQFSNDEPNQEPQNEKESLVSSNPTNEKELPKNKLTNNNTTMIITTPISEDHHPKKRKRKKSKSNRKKIYTIPEVVPNNATTLYRWMHDTENNSNQTNHDSDDNNTNETNHHRIWEPPLGIPYLRSKDFVRIFQNENTLWLGDSTCRQDYHTLYNLQQHYWEQFSSDENNNSNQNKIGLDIKSSILNKNINKAKSNYGNVPFYCPNRSVPQKDRIFFRDLGQFRHETTNDSWRCNTTQGIATAQSINPRNESYVDIWSLRNFFKHHPKRSGSFELFALQQQQDNSNQHAATATSTTTNTGKFDYADAKCLLNIRPLLDYYNDLIRNEYSVLVFSVGVWEVLRPDECQNKFPENTTNVLEYLEKHWASPNLYIVWKLHGPNDFHWKSGRRGTQKVLTQRDVRIATEIRNWFDLRQPQHMGLADFRHAVFPRSKGKERLSGDHPAHWGWQARLLSIEIIANVLQEKQKQQQQRLSRPGAVSNDTTKS